VIGQTNFDTGNAGISATTLYQPAGVAVAGNHLYVGDTQNSRVLRYDLP
jgi:hypothetical protein